MNNLLSVARHGHTTTITDGGASLLVCGGANESAPALATCDLLDAVTLAPKSSPLVLATPRTGHAAAALETGPVVIAGGVGSDAMPVGSIEIYTP
jgi:hypothetical protein